MIMQQPIEQIFSLFISLDCVLWLSACRRRMEFVALLLSGNREGVNHKGLP